MKSTPFCCRISGLELTSFEQLRLKYPPNAMRKFKLLFLLVSVFTFLSSTNAFSASVQARSGNIFLCQNQGNEVQLTFRGEDRAPVLSLDGKQIAFIRKSTTRADYLIGDPSDWETEEPMADQIWLIGSDGSGERLLVQENVAAGESEKRIAHLDDGSLRFSPNGDKVYFIGDAWVTSGALHVVNIDGSNERFLMAANYIEIVPNGEYQGHLLVQQHRYFVGAGSYDWLWLFDSDGKEVGVIGEELTEGQRDRFRMGV